MAMNPLTDHGPNHRADDDDENKQGKRKMYMNMELKDNQTSETKNKKMFTPSKSKHGTPHSSGKEKIVSCKVEKTQTNGIRGPREVKSPAMIRAEHVQLSLGTESPSILKLMVRSHVHSSFCVTLPGSFCRSYLPINNSVIILEDESEEQFEVKYIPKWRGLSGGWKNFAVQHKLCEQDVLVFHLVAPSKFKVYIVRANDTSEVDGAPSLLDEQNEPGENLGSDDNEDTRTTALKIKRTKYIKSSSETTIQKNIKRALLEHKMEQFENESEEVISSEFSERSNSSDHTTNPCKGLETFEKFHIMVNGMCVDSELHENMRKKYYELCCCKDAILHDGLLPSLNIKLVAGVISETVNIVCSIKACNFATSRDELEQWEKSLKSFELLGMNVGFLLNWLSQLLRLESESELARFEDEIKNLEVKRVELKEAYEKLGCDIEKLKSKAERQHLKFREVVNAPW